MDPREIMSDQFMGIDEFIQSLGWRMRLRIWFAGFGVRRKIYALGYRAGRASVQPSYGPPASGKGE